MEENERTDPEEEAREAAGEHSMRPDIQGGALRMAEGDEPEEHELPSFRERADERDERDEPDDVG
jgi:hypothetical protein